MSTILPVIASGDRCLAEVLTSAFASVKGQSNTLNLVPSKRTIVVLVDGLGSHNLMERKAHARTLTSLSMRTVSAGFPTTTASAVASLMTAVDPGVNGMVGYAVRNPITGEIINQLSGLDAIDVDHWQPIPTVWELNIDVPSVVISSERYRHSGLTKAVLRGSHYVGASTHDERLNAVHQFLTEEDSGVAYVYIPDLDMAAHSRGVNSDEWARKLEDLDGFVRDLMRLLGTRDGLLLTADHGIIDVPPHKHLIIPTDSPLLDGVTTGGEPRFLHLYYEGDSTELAHRWLESEGERAFVATREQAIEAGWFGTVDSHHRDRIGDVLVTPRGTAVYYDSRIATSQSMSMIGQHGGLTPTERLVPLISAGIFT